MRSPWENSEKKCSSDRPKSKLRDRTVVACVTNPFLASQEGAQ